MEARDTSATHARCDSLFFDEMAKRYLFREAADAPWLELDELPNQRQAGSIKGGRCLYRSCEEAMLSSKGSSVINTTANIYICMISMKWGVDRTCATRSVLYRADNIAGPYEEDNPGNPIRDTEA